MWVCYVFGGILIFNQYAEKEGNVLTSQWLRSDLTIHVLTQAAAPLAADALHGFMILLG